MEPQTVIFTSNEDYSLKRNKMYDNIKKTIDEWVIKDKFEYEHMSYQGLTTSQELNIKESLTHELKVFTQHKCDDWCEKTSFYIILGIRALLYGLVEIKRMTDLSATECANLIHNSIMYQLDNDKNYPCLLDDIATFPDISETE